MRRSSVVRLAAVIAIAAVMGAVGAGAILFFMNQGPGGGASFYAIPSIITWLILYRYVCNRSVWRAAGVGLLSPLAGSLVGLLFVFQGLYWAVYMIRYWWITLPVALLTALLIQLVCSRYESGYSPVPRLIALAVIVAATGAAAAPPLLRMQRDPLHAEPAVIRSRLLQAAPAGSSPQAVLKALGTTIPYDSEETQRWFFQSAPQYQRGPARKIVDGYLSLPVGENHISILLGWYYTGAGRMNVFVSWAFDSDDKLIDVFVRKKLIR